MKYRLVLFAANLHAAYVPRLCLKRKASYIIYFKERADLCTLAKRESFDCGLYGLGENYFVVTDTRRAAQRALEYGAAAGITEAALKEYGTKLSDKDGLKIVREYF